MHKHIAKECALEASAYDFQLKSYYNYQTNYEERESLLEDLESIEAGYI